ncbi:hypothetical protein MYX82_11960 [Acidobacteria bacterium AH-259-D05]|nr:hypothetical protein [Acidobacteria bacterium AH-259-D05]
MVDDLIDIAILEKKPDQVLHWYDQLPKKRFGLHSVDDDEIAAAVQTHAPDRAVAIWKKKAERLIAQVKPSAYQEAVKYLHKAGSVMARQKNQKQWDQYLQNLREQHARKRRLMKILDGLDGKPIVKKALTTMSSGSKHKWTFRARFRRHAFGWRSQPAIKRIKEALASKKQIPISGRKRLRKANNEAFWFAATQVIASVTSLTCAALIAFMLAGEKHSNMLVQR